jgi:hypothetical protein
MKINKNKICDAQVITTSILLVIYTLTLPFLLLSFTLYFFFHSLQILQSSLTL